MFYEMSAGCRNEGHVENFLETKDFMWQSTDDWLSCIVYCHLCSRQLVLQLTDKAHGHQYVENLKTCDLPRLSSMLHLHVSSQVFISTFCNLKTVTLMLLSY
jgi:hypothetical protein